MMATPETEEPTPDQIIIAVNNMCGVLQILDALIKSPREDKPRVPFAENVRHALAGFDRSDIRNALVDRIYHPEKYVK